MTAYGSIETAVQAMRSGAFDFVQKPVPIDELLDKLEAARQRRVEHEEKIIRAEGLRLTRRTGDI